MMIVPLQAVPSQAVNVLLAEQNTNLIISQKSTGLFIDVYLGSTAIILGVLCENANRIIRDAYLGFIGDFIFVDNQGADDPNFTGLDGRFVLVYLEAADTIDGVQ